jgi:uracil-DNA glycosylase
LPSAFKHLSKKIRACRVCESSLPLGANPVFQAAPEASVLVAGQAPGIRVHNTGIPFNDPSGDRLRQWMGVDRELFYSANKIALVPMGFCYPGTGKSGDLPPRPECAQTWHQSLLAALPNVVLAIAIGQYAHRYYLQATRKSTLTETVRNWQNYGPDIIPLPHPSPRNNIWIKKNPWFEIEVIPVLQDRVAAALNFPG